MIKFLDNTGLAYLWNKITALFSNVVYNEADDGGSGEASIPSEGGSGSGGGTDDYNDLSNKPQINSVTLSGNKSASDLGLATTAQGALADTAYQLPSGGIPDTDLSSSVQASLALADSSLQSHQDISGKANKSEMSVVAGTGNDSDKTTITLKTGTSATVLTSHQDITGKQDTINDLSTIRTGAGLGATAYQLPSGGIPDTDLSSTVQTSLGKADTALQSYTETDPVFLASAAYGISSSDITNWNGKTSNTGTITGITMNGSSKGTSGVVDLGTVVVSEADPIFTASAAYGISSSDITNWNNKGTYSKPSDGIPASDIASGVIPTVPTNVSSFTNDANYVTSNNTVTIYSGSSAPSGSLGSNGDIYIQTT